MGHTIWYDTQGRQPFDETPADCSITHRLMDNLDALATRLGVTKLSDFYDYTVLANEFADFDEENEDESEDVEDEESATKEDSATGDWSDPTDVLKSLRALRTHLAAHFEDLGFTADDSRKHWPEQLMEELELGEEVMEDAAKRGRRVRLLIVG